jgi:hypothetical protein
MPFVFLTNYNLIQFNLIDLKNKIQKVSFRQNLYSTFGQLFFLFAKISSLTICVKTNKCLFSENLKTITWNEKSLEFKQTFF